MSFGHINSITLNTVSLNTISGDVYHQINYKMCHPLETYGTGYIIVISMDPKENFYDDLQRHLEP
ncbi:hypothetical protein [Bacillus cereus]|uniref:hypothetical protein n=1 Tax=Bacillus cereus TaxID=1396 RepID=UPI001145A187|nr:hypothetical protein [Bacillus cereus]